MSDLKAAYRKLDPAKPLQGDQFESYYVSRPGDPIALLAEELSYREEPLRVLLVGQRGVGKSTELIRLVKLLEHRQKSLYLLDLSQGKGYCTADTLMVEFVRQLVKKAPSLKQTAPLGHQWDFSFHNSTLAALDLVTALGRDGRPVILLDGFERLPSGDLLELFSALVSLPCSLVVIAPIRIVLQPEFASPLGEWDQIVPLPAVSVVTMGHTPDPAGITLLQSVLQRRAGETAFDNAALDLIVPASGGIHRDLLTLAQQACVRAGVAGKTVVTSDEALAAVEQRRQDYSFQLTPQDWGTLKRLDDSKFIARDAGLISLLERNLIVSYRSDWTWFGVHPILDPLLKRVVPTPV
jgi:GTPase SAR1 family protein